MLHARQLLHRYGVVFRDLLQRESALPAWRDLLVCLRKLEALGEIRGGRFVDGFVGEQFALPEALDGLRALRRSPPRTTELVRVAATDPLNLVGITSPGPLVQSPSPAVRVASSFCEPSLAVTKKWQRTSRIPTCALPQMQLKSTCH
jgi:hypothetical protein